MRPELVALVAGTGTGVGKTWVGARLAVELRARGLSVAARKPVQSFEPGSGATDAEVLAEATGEDPQAVCPAHRWLPVAMAPPMAAEVLGLDGFTVAELAGELRWPPSVHVGLVESVGGARSPVATDGDTADLAAATAPDLAVLVADAGLGVLHAVRSALPALAPWPTVVVLNRYDEGDDLHRRNLAWLAGRDRVDVVTGVGALADRVLSHASLR